MKELVDGLLRDERLPYLEDEREFRELRFRLLRMKEKLDAGEELSDADHYLLGYARAHIQNIYPHYQRCLVNGEWQDVFFKTLPVLTVRDFRDILVSLEYTKKNYRDCTDYPSCEFKQQQLAAVDALMDKCRQLRDAAQQEVSAFAETSV